MIDWYGNSAPSPSAPDGIREITPTIKHSIIRINQSRFTRNLCIMLSCKPLLGFCFQFQRRRLYTHRRLDVIDANA